MTMDRITESIAHFIGVFALAEESGRLRAQYDKISAQRPPDEDLGDLAFKGLNMKPEHPLEDLDPQIAYLPLPPTPFWILATPPRPVDAPQPEIVIVTPSPTLPDATGTGSDEATPNLMLPYELPPPSSVAAMIHMSNRLDDADWFGEIDPALMAQMSGLPQLMQMLTDQMLALSPLEAPLPVLAGGAAETLDWAIMTPTIVEAAGQLAGGALGAVVLQGEQALGLYVDGVAVETLPDWLALWPELLAREAETQDGEDPEHDQEESGIASGSDDGAETVGSAPDFAAGWDRALEGLEEAVQSPSGPAKPDGPLVVTGANKLVNEVSITSDWLDAPVIVVEGDVHSFDAVSQVNMVFDRDQGVSAQDAPSLAQNAASITVTAAPQANDMATGQQPGGWAIARITGDLIQINGVQQYNFANDSDVARIELGSGGLHLGLGGNQLENLAVLNQFGWVFDMIIVGGQMIDVNMIRQVNLLVDDDTVEQPPPPTAEAGKETASGALVSKTNDIAPSDGSTTDVSGPKSGVADDQHLSMSGNAQHGKALAKESVSDSVQLLAPAGKAIGTSDHPSPAKTVSQSAASEPAAGLHTDTGTTTSPNPATTDLGPIASVSRDTTGAAPAKLGSHEAVGSKPTTSADPVASADAASTTKPVAVKTTPPTVEGAAGNPAAAAKPLAEPSPTIAPENLAYNEARIQSEGQDLAAKLPAALAEVSAALAKGAETLEQEILGLDLFEGVELLKVLLIEGDFTTINWIDQINVLGDSDRVEMLQEAIAALPGAQMATGSNLLANIATIVDRGVDTQLMAKGEIYTDALLHQAGLVEDGAPTDAAGPAELTSEAVAFLAEGMIEAAMTDMEVAQAAAQSELAAMSASQADLMQTMLS